MNNIDSINNANRLKSLIVVGYIASGKSTYVESIKQPDDLVIELGDIVRELTHRETRTFDNSLDDAIYERCKEIVETADIHINRVIFVAPRSPQLMDRLTKLIKDYEIVFLFVPYRIREQRFNKSQRAKDEGITYIEALQKDNAIGMEKLVTGLINDLWGPCKSVHNV